MANYNTDFITITSLNTRGIMGNINYVAQICKSTDILCLQEHHLFEHNVSLLSSIDTGIRAFSRCNSYVRNDGKSIYRGGTAIIWKAGINHQITKLLGGNMARFTQFPLMITRLTIIYEIISPGAAGSSIYV